MRHQVHLASLSSSSPPYLADSHQGWTPSGTESSSGAKISPAILLVIVILAVLFFISGILHLLVRFLIRHPSTASSQLNRPPDISDSDALQRQLQQLFDLHDSGLDQTFIDALPVFHFKELMGLKDQFDCSVCLCEFAENDMLRLLPICGHAFHINCIDTWLQSNSTCPLCRATLFASPDNPIFDFDDPRVGCGAPGTGESRFSARRTAESDEMNGRKGILSVRLGKFRKINDDVDSSGGETSSSNIDARRCYSMGSYQYVLGHENLRIPLGRNPNAMRGHGGSDSDCEDGEGRNSIFASRGDSLSVSKIWLWSGKNRYHNSLDTHQEGTFPGINIELPWVDRTEGV